MDREYPGIARVILQFEHARLPRCRVCGSRETAEVYVGTTQRSQQIAFATSKVHLIARNPAEGKYYCHACGQYFN